MTIATILPEARTVFLDTNNIPLVGGQVFMYVPNTTTPKTTWQDAAGATPNSNPIILDGQGSCLLYGSGQYSQTLKDASGNLIWTGLTQDLYSLIVTNGNFFKTLAKQIFTSSGTYTPTAGMVYCIAEVVGGGGGGAGAGTNNPFVCQSGSGGAYARSVLSAATVGASQTITIGAGGAGGNNSGSNASNGGTSSLGSLIVCGGGNGGVSVTAIGLIAGIAGGVASAGDVQIPGGNSNFGSGSTATVQLNFSGAGGNSFYGQGGLPQTSVNHPGASGTGYGAGGAGATGNGTGNTGGNGTAGIIIITEYCSQ